MPPRLTLLTQRAAPLGAALLLAPLLALSPLASPARAEEPAAPAAEAPAPAAEAPAPAPAPTIAAQSPETAAAEAAREERLEELRYKHMWLAFGAVWVILFVFVRQTYARSAAVGARLDELKARVATLEGAAGAGGARREEG